MSCATHVGMPPGSVAVLICSACDRDSYAPYASTTVTTTATTTAEPRSVTLCGRGRSGSCARRQRQVLILGESRASRPHEADPHRQARTRAGSRPVRCESSRLRLPKDRLERPAGRPSGPRMNRRLKVSSARLRALRRNAPQTRWRVVRARTARRHRTAPTLGLPCRWAGSRRRVSGYLLSRARNSLVKPEDFVEVLSGTTFPRTWGRTFRSARATEPRAPA